MTTVGARINQVSRNFRGGRQLDGSMRSRISCFRDHLLPNGGIMAGQRGAIVLDGVKVCCVTAERLRLLHTIASSLYNPPPLSAPLFCLSSIKPPQSSLNDKSTPKDPRYSTNQRTCSVGVRSLSNLLIIITSLHSVQPRAIADFGHYRRRPERSPGGLRTGWRL